MKRGLAGWTIAALMIVTGALLVYFSHAVPYPELDHVITEIGVALMVAGFLGVTVDLFVKRAITSDAVEAALGYLLPAPLKGEMKWLYDLKILCERHHANVRVDLIAAGWTRVSVRFDRTLVNVSDTEHTFTLGLAIDEWGAPDWKSAIRSFGYQIGEERHEFDESTLIIQHRDGEAVAIKPIECTLKPRGRLTMWAEYEEIRSENDQHLIVFQHPTLNPHVQVSGHPSLNIRSGFSHREKWSSMQLGAGASELEGLLLPHQHIRVRWWPKR
jgi:hypothetical protein